MKLLYAIAVPVAIGVLAIAAGAFFRTETPQQTSAFIEMTEQENEYEDNTDAVTLGLPEADQGKKLPDETGAQKTNTYSYGDYTFSVNVPEGYSVDLHDHLAPKSVQVGITNTINEKQRLNIHVVESDYCAFEYCFLPTSEWINLNGTVWNYRGTHQYSDAGATGEVKYVYSHISGNYVVYVTSNQKLQATQDMSLSEIFSSIQINVSKQSQAVVAIPADEAMLYELPYGSVEQALNYLTGPAQTRISDFNLDYDAYPRDILADNAGPMPGGGAYTVSDVAWHSLYTDCRISKEGRVYDITPLLSFANLHSSIAMLSNSCGSDITEAISASSVEPGSVNTARMQYVLSQFYIGYILN